MESPWNESRGRQRPEAINSKSPVDQNRRVHHASHKDQQVHIAKYRTDADKYQYDQIDPAFGSQAKLPKLIAAG